MLFTEDNFYPRSEVWFAIYSSNLIHFLHSRKSKQAESSTGWNCTVKRIGARMSHVVAIRGAESSTYYSEIEGSLKRLSVKLNLINRW